MAPGAVEQREDAPTQTPLTKLPPGMVLGPDGKPCVSSLELRALLLSFLTYS